jgi:small subunit ribosomal protein S18
MFRKFGKPKSTDMRKGKRKTRYHEQAKCRFCRDKVDQVDYKNIAVLIKVTTQQGKIFSRKRSGNCAAHQRSCQLAIKRARFLGLLPYVG